LWNVTYTLPINDNGNKVSKDAQDPLSISYPADRYKAAESQPWMSAMVFNCNDVTSNGQTATALNDKQILWQSGRSDQSVSAAVSNNYKNLSVYIKNNGELWGAGANFYTGSWFPLSVPSKIGNKTDWKEFHDFLSTEQAILVEKDNGSIWGAGANWNFVLTDDPCPDPRNQVETIGITYTKQKQKTEYGVIMSAGVATFTFNIGTTVINVGGVTNTTNLLSGLVTKFNANSTLPTNFTLTTTPTGSGSSTILFEAKNYTPHNFGYSITAVESTTVASFTGAVSFSDTVENISGAVTYTLILNGIKIDASASSAIDAVSNLRSAIQNNNSVNSPAFSLTASGTQLIIENLENRSFNVRAELQTSNTSSGTISKLTSAQASSTQQRVSVD
jgi:hypothetical protein